MNYGVVDELRAQGYLVDTTVHGPGRKSGAKAQMWVQPVKTSDTWEVQVWDYHKRRRLELETSIASSMMRTDWQRSG
jgi:hypothetical protein